MELGLPCGPKPTGRSLENQVQFFEFFGERFATDRQLRAATVFQLYDWSPEFAQIFNQAFIDAGEPETAARLEEWLATVGLVRWSDRSNRPSWEAWLSALRKARSAREDED